MEIKKCSVCATPVPGSETDERLYHLCSIECRRELREKLGNRGRVIRPCGICGTSVSRPISSAYKNPCCSPKCFKAFQSKNMAQLNSELNPSRMDSSETRAKIRLSRLGKGEGKAYRKYYGRHVHRIVAEQKLGRPLKPGEVVHHIDENILNNHPDNLVVFASQAEHARHHMVKMRKEGKL